MGNEQDQIKDSKEMRKKFEQILDKYNVKSDDKNELKGLSSHMRTFDDEY